MGEMFSRQSTVALDLRSPGVFDVSSIPEDETELVGAALSACWGVGFGAVNVTHALAEAGLAPMRHYLIILDELWRALIAGRGMVDRTNCADPPEPPVGGGGGDVLAHDQGPAEPAGRARADESARADRAVRDVDLRGAARRRRCRASRWRRTSAWPSSGS